MLLDLWGSNHRYFLFCATTPARTANHLYKQEYTVAIHISCCTELMRGIHTTSVSTEFDNT